MTTIPLASSFLDSIDFNPPFELPEVEISTDRRMAAEMLIDLGLQAKASSLVTCKKFFIPILEYQNHWARLGNATCHLKFACPDCGNGRARAHRLYTVAPHRFKHITREVTRTIRLTMAHTDACLSPLDYARRVKADKLKFSKIRKKYLLGGTISALELDPHMQDVTFRVYHLGKIANRHWERTGASTRAWDDPKEALAWVLDGYWDVLQLPGSQRALWESAFSGMRLTSNCGSLRGIDVDEPAYDKQPGEALYGYCPCGCGGVVTRAASHKAESAETLGERYQKLSFGPLKDYVPYSPKGIPYNREKYIILPKIDPVAASPPC